MAIGETFVLQKAIPENIMLELTIYNDYIDKAEKSIPNHPLPHKYMKNNQLPGHWKLQHTRVKLLQVTISQS